MKFFIKAYRLIVSPFTGPSCRFYPSCSSYALEAIERHGPLAGLYLAIRRIAKCHPFSTCESFHDPVPERFDWSGWLRYKRLNK